MDERPLSCTVSIARRINLGKYEHADIFISVSNVTAATTSEEIEEILDGAAQDAFVQVSRRVKARVKAARVDGTND